jgi:8-oxo-dGTP pyrophosphatase MutT (NUDIX family)
MSQPSRETPAGIKTRLRAALAGSRPSLPGEESLAGLPLEVTARFRHLIPADATAAAVLVPIVDHADGLTVLLTERASDLRHHPGQISFPGGRLEPDDDGPVAAALRETEEEIGLPRKHVEVLGFLPDHVILTGYRVTPVVALVEPGVALSIDATEVASVFEVPLAFILDPANHHLRRRPVGIDHVDVYDLPFGTRNIWGATAGMLVSLTRLLGADPGAARR